MVTDGSSVERSEPVCPFDVKAFSRAVTEFYRAAGAAGMPILGIVLGVNHYVTYTDWVDVRSTSHPRYATCMGVPLFPASSVRDIRDMRVPMALPYYKG